MADETTDQGATAGDARGSGGASSPSAKKSAAKKSAGKKATAKKSSKKSAGKKATAKTSSKKSAGKKATAKKSSKKSAGKKATAKKATAKTSSKKSAGKRATAKKSSKRSAKVSAKKSVATKATVKKAATKKAAAKKAATATAKTSSKKSAGKKATAKKSAARKSAGKRAPVKKAAAVAAATAAGAATARSSASSESATDLVEAQTAAAERTPAANPGPADTAPPPEIALPAVSATAADGADRPGAVMGLDGRPVDPVWLDAYPPLVAPTYTYPEVPFTLLLDEAANDFPDVIATHFEGSELTWRELVDQVDRLAAALAGLGVTKGDRVGLILPNIPQHVVAIFAVLRLGAIVSENNPLYTSDELAHQLADADAKVIICLDPIYPRVKEIRDQLPNLEHVITTGIQDALGGIKSKLFPLKGKRDGTYYKVPADEGVLSMKGLIDQSAPTVPDVPIDAAEDIAFLVYTGGTTGTSKGVMLTHHNLVANALQARLWMPDVTNGRENILGVMPFFHSYGLTTVLGLGVLSAATMTLLARFEVDRALAAIDSQKPTLFPGVPTIYVAINEAVAAGGKAAKRDLRSIRACLSGAAPLPVEVANTFEELTGGKLREGYGLTETSPITHANPIYGKAKKGSIGLPVTDTTCMLVDIDDHTKRAADGEPGELAITGPQVMKGYWNRPEETAVVLKDGWLLTGDVAVIDEEGYVSIVDRKKDMIIAGGYNVYPRDVEEVLYAHPAVSKACVAGIPDDYRGETVKAFIVLKEGQSATTEELDAFLRDQLAAYKVPKEYAFRDSLPETIVGKTLRRELVAEELAARQASRP